MISTQVDPVTKVALPGVRPSPMTDALGFLDKAYAVAGTRGSNVFRKESLKDGVWGAVLYKDRNLNSQSAARAAAVVAWYMQWLPPWGARVPTPAAAAAASSSRPTRKRSRS